MPLIYTLVARGTTVLADFNVPSVSGNFAMVTKRILEKIPAQNAKMSYMYDRHIFHYVVEDGLVYMTMADEAFGRRIPFAFLEDIKNRFKAASVTAIADAPPLQAQWLRCGFRESSGLCDPSQDFSRVLAQQMDYFSNNPNADKLNKVKSDLDQLQTVMVQNIEKVLERGERIELLVDRTESLNSTSLAFKKQSTSLKSALWWKNVRLWLIIIALVAVLVFIIVWMGCGATFQRCRGSHSSSPAPPPPPPPTTLPPPPPTTTAPPA